MLKVKRLSRSIIRLIVPIVVVVVLAGVSASLWLIHTSARPQAVGYLVTPAKYGLLSSRGAQVTDETWVNHDGTTARGWILRGSESSPAVILLHKFGADRSYELNLGVKLSEATNFTILMPDLRGHGESPVVEFSSFGEYESEDVLAAADYLRSLRTPEGTPLVGNKIGIYGVELGALSALRAATRDQAIAALALDSVPGDSDAVISSAIGRRFPFFTSVTSRLAVAGARAYYFNGSFQNLSSCDAGKIVVGRKVLLLAGVDEPDLQASTTKLGRCMQNEPNLETKFDLSPSGYSIISSSIERSQEYEQRVIDFFRLSLAN
jgi:pimeloyl-ACP methyl ester carboxylesterase